MPRKNKRKDYNIGRPAVFFGSPTDNPGYKPECVGCAFAGYGFVCQTSDGTCLKITKSSPERRDANDRHQ